MSALSEAVNSNGSPGPRCSIGLLIRRLPDDVANDLDELLASDTYSSVIADGLSQIGYYVQGGTLQRHRKGRCLCGRAR